MHGRALRMSPAATDTALAAAAALGAAVLDVIFAAWWGLRLDLGASAMLLLGAVSLAATTRLPMFTAVIVGATTPLYYMLGPVDGIWGWAAFLVGVFRMAAAGRRFAAASGTVVALLLFAAGEVFGPFNLGRALGVIAWMLVVVSAGEISRSRRAYLREVEQRAAEAERTREEEARRRATEERLRIARELHDVLAHQISLINVQAGAALHRRDPERAYSALDAIKQASKDTLRELRSTLGVLRQVDTEDGAAPVSPAPSLARLGALAAQTEDAGLPVRLTVEGDAVPLPAKVDLAAYRIVQEALTNTVRHAGRARASVLVRYRADEVAVRVEDDGAAAAGAAVPEGNGLRGMRERAEAVGGSLDAGPRAQGGFAVDAVLPLRGEDMPDRKSP